MAAAGAKRKNTAGAKAEAEAEAQADGAQQAKRRQAEPIACASEEMEDSLSASEDSDADSSGSDTEMGDGETKLAGENTGDGDDNAAAGKQHRGGKAATNSEIMALNEAALLFKSNLFKLQADELLGEALVVAGTKETRGLDAALRQIREVLVALEEVPAVDVDAASNLARKLGVSIPFPDPAPPAGMALQLAFSAPAAVTVVGSYALGMAVRTRSGITVDVAAQMPAALFQDRDHLNCRYFYKRAFYVAMLVAGLRRSALNDAFDIGVEAVRDDARLPAVVLRPRTRRVGGSVRLLPCIAGDTLALARLGGARNSLRPSFIAAGAADEDAPPTPQYNAALAGDALMVAHMRFLHETAGMCPAFARGAALLRVWLRQRVGLGAQARVTGFALSLVLAWLVRQGRVGSGLGAHALFKACVEFLAARDFEAQPVAFGAALAGFGGAVLADPTATTNVLAGVGDGELAELRLAARAAALDANAADDRFARIFLAAPAPAVQRFDHVLRLDVALAPFLAPRGGAAARRLAELDHGSPVAAVRARIEALLGAALDAQARAVVVRAAPCALGDLVRAQRRHVFVVGLVARGDAAQRVVGLGPSPAGDAAAAARFRALWGARAELRRFRDGAIRLATVWGGADAAPEQRALVLPRMAAFLVRRHFAAHAGAADVLTREDREAADRDPPRAALPFAGTQPRALSLAPRLDGFAQTQGAGGAAFEPALAALDELHRELAALEHQLPLRVLALHAAAPALRYASLAPPKPLRGGADDAFVAPLPVAVEFVGSTRWPDDLVALHKVKAAFLLRLGACYAAAHPGAAVAAGDRLLGRGARDGVVPRADDCFVDIGHAASGLTFRLWVLCDREGALLERRARDLRLVPALHAQASAYEDAHRRWLLAC
ncbi:U3 snoRNP protein, partial [Kickxella alabastrina]